MSNTKELEKNLRKLLQVACGPKRVKKENEAIKTTDNPYNTE